MAGLPLSISRLLLVALLAVPAPVSKASWVGRPDYTREGPRHVVVSGSTVGTLIAQSDDQRQKIGNAVEFALQCNAKFGAISGVEVTSLENAESDSVTVRGVYTEKMGVGLNVFIIQGTGDMGGIFQGIFDNSTQRLVQLYWKVSATTGQVSQDCLQ